LLAFVPLTVIKSARPAHKSRTNAFSRPKEQLAMNIIQRFAQMLLILALATSAVAQTAATADLRGTVKDPNGAVVQNATVTVRDAARNFERFTQSNDSGFFTWPKTWA
jgi:hypothetical protein